MSVSTELYPIKFTPLLKDKLWGGDMLKKVLGKDASDAAGESWEVSGIAGSESVVANGPLAGQTLPHLIATYQDQLVGKKVFARYGTEFPLLIKFIHANEDLSIQVHPSDAQSDGFGKTEMWYVIWAEEGASLLSGFKSDVTKEVLRDAIASGAFDQYMNRVPVKAGDTFFIPANQVHTIGGGLLIAEIQQSSDITYRIYDFNRTDLKGNKRELHIDQAFEVMSLETETGKIEYAKTAELIQLVSCPEFVTNKYVLSDSRVFKTTADSFKIYMNVGGQAEAIFADQVMPLNMGETIFLPADMSFKIKPTSGEILILETRPGI
jgi:mannose-6-phosphate isomerase